MILAQKMTSVKLQNPRDIAPLSTILAPLANRTDLDNPAQISFIKYKFNFYLASSPASSSSLLKLPIYSNTTYQMQYV